MYLLKRKPVFLWNLLDLKRREPAMASRITAKALKRTVHL
jgi:hypothetical protein